MVAHIAGIPVEETALSLAPLAAVTAGIAGVMLRDRVMRLRAGGGRGLAPPRKAK